jgi:hypothetical protein
MAIMKDAFPELDRLLTPPLVFNKKTSNGLIPQGGGTSFIQ